MLQRILTAIIGIPLMLALLYWGGEFQGGWIMFVVFAALVLIGMGELFNALDDADRPAVPWAGYIPAILYLVGLWFLGSARTGQDTDQALALMRREEVAAFAVVLCVMASLAGKVVQRDVDHVLSATSSTLLVFLYVAFLFGYFLRLRRMELPGANPPGDWAGWQDFSLKCGALLLAVAPTWLTDAGAYFVGKALGKVKLVPAVSPGKTVEGCLGGLLSASLAGILVAWLVGLRPYHGFAVGVICGLMGQMGDLAESIIKRNLGLKDLGSLFPGHGGVLDRFDSLLFTMPATYYYLLFAIPSP